ncbi:MAG: 50S ribosomal protein L3 N(5)-glutamine methyltransferase [Gammaproteobacteria bacterium]|nr:50S ribosomal protein L3 N(5)-glutamine methyltransferase [Gammaproteobacteria bacterium]
MKNSIITNLSDDIDTLRTVGDLVRWGCSQLGAAGVFFGHGTDNAADEARALVFHALSLDPAVPDYFYQSRVTSGERHAAVDLLRRRIDTRVPAAYLTGTAWFAGLRFAVDERALVPRSPLAELIANRFAPWLENPEPHRILDLCTGCGCIAVACSYAFGDAMVDAVDIDQDALELARENVGLHEVSERVTLVESDLFSALDGRRYDLIVSNPPYVPAASMAQLPQEYQHEPEIALLAADNGLAVVRRIVATAREFLTPDGVLVVEVGESMPQAAREFSHLPLHWCEFEHGGEGVFIISAAELPQPSG